MVRPGGATASPSDPGYVRVDRRAGVAIVTLDHPADRNALSLTMTRALVEAVRQVTADERIGAMVLSATGTVFSAGGSVDDLPSPGHPCARCMPDSSLSWSAGCRPSPRSTVRPSGPA
jgi:enoyl-CoA hydratase/carnithine racemase